MSESRDDTININGSQEEILQEYLDITKNIIDKVLNTEKIKSRKDRARFLFDAIIENLEDEVDGDSTEEHS